MLKRCFLSIFILAVLMGGTALGAEPVRIGVTLGLTGKYKQMSDMQMKGYRLWEGQVNSRGGLLGRRVEVLIKDDESDGPTAANLYERMIAADKVDHILGPYSSSITNAILPVASRHGYPLLVGGASSNRLWKQGYQNVFGVYTPASRYAVGFLEMLVMSDIGKLAVVSADDSFSISISEGTVKWAGRYGLDVALTRNFKKGTEAFGELVEEMRQSGAQALIVCGHFQESVAVREAISSAGWQPLAYFASVGPVLEDYMNQLGELADFTFSSSQWEPHPDLDFPGSKEFLRDFEAAYHKAPSYHAATAFAAGSILEKAIIKAGTLDRKRVSEVLYGLDTMSLIGRFGVDRTGMQIRQFPVIIQWQKGRKEIVWPKELRTADPVFVEDPDAR